MKAAAHASGSLAKALDVAQAPRSSSQSTASASCPARPIADLAFSESATARAFVCFFIVSASDGASIRRALSPLPEKLPYVISVASASSVQVTLRCEARSYHAFWIMPCRQGSVPVAIVVCPVHVSVDMYG